MEKKKTIKLTDELIHNWTILCSSSSVDEKSKNISIFNVIETLKLELVPSQEQEKEKEKKGWYSVPFNLELITKFQKLNIDLDLVLDLRYQIVDSRGKEIGTKFGSVLKFGKGNDTLRIRNGIGMFPVTESGFYKITVSVNNVETGNFTQIGEMYFKIDVNIKELSKKDR